MSVKNTIIINEQSFHIPDGYWLTYKDMATRIKPQSGRILFLMVAIEESRNNQFLDMCGGYNPKHIFFSYHDNHMKYKFVDNKMTITQKRIINKLAGDNKIIIVYQIQPILYQCFNISDVIL